MSTDIRATEARLLQLLEQAEDQEGPLIRHQTSWEAWRAEGSPDGPPDWLIDAEDSVVRPFERTAEQLYRTAVLLLESRHLTTYLQQFLNKFGKDFDKSNAASKFELDLEYPNNGYNIFLHDFYNFLRPLNIFKDAQHHRAIEGLRYLENILKNTASTIIKLEAKPRSEAQVYNAIRPVLEATFPSARDAKSNFFKLNQTYNPDILIPELCAAVEYKYAESEAKFKACIDQVSADVKGYTGDADYNQFYAVFYLTKDFWGPEKFKAVWAEMQHPTNWHFLYVVGSANEPKPLAPP